MARIQDSITAIEPNASVERYTGLGVDVVKGYARFVDPWTVDIALNDAGTQRLTSRSIVIAAGAAPTVPPLPGLDEVGFVTSDTLWQRFADRDESPARLLALWTWPVCCELCPH